MSVNLCLKSFLCISRFPQRWRPLRPFSYIHHVGKDPLKYISVGTLLEESANKYRDRPAIISRHQKKTVTFGDVLDEADKLAAGLIATGLKKGDRVGIYLPNQYEWHIIMMACARAGLVMVALNPIYQPPEIQYCINKVGIKTIICGAKFKGQDYYEIMNKVAPEIYASEPGKLNSANTPTLKSVILVTDEQMKGTFNYGEVLDFADTKRITDVKKSQHLVVPDDECNIQFTSGTTGKPKAAVLSHFNAVNNSYSVAKRIELDTKHHKICVQVPLFHAFGIIIALVTAMHHGSTLVLPGFSYNPNESLDAIKEEKCSVIYGTPTMYVDLVDVQSKRKEDISPEIAVTGGAPCAPELFKRMLNELNVKKVKTVYGLSESTAVIFNSLPNEDVEKSISTVGYVGEHLEYKVIDAQGKVVPFGEPGELCVRGYCSMLCYWDDEDKTKEMIGPDKWLKTGDQFILEADGYGRIVGRIKEMIIRGGENIFPKEIEDFLTTHPDILECFVIGLKHDRLGEEVCACVRLKEGATLTIESLKEFCKGQIAPFKVPSRLRIMKEFPKTATGKVQKFVLKQQIDG